MSFDVVMDGSTLDSRFRHKGQGLEVGQEFDWGQQCHGCLLVIRVTSPFRLVMLGQGISSSILRARLIFDGKMEIRQDLRPTDLAVTEIACGGEILKIFVVSNDFSTFRRKLQIVLPMLESYNNG